jgi:Family of unknown function (DUF5683)
VKRFFYIVILVLLIGSPTAFAQDDLKIENATINDTLKKSDINPLAPSKAAFYSAILPGLGQAYNKKYWKIPIVYGAIGAGVYFHVWNNQRYNSFRNAYKRRLAGFNDDEYQFLDDDRLIQGQKFYQKNRDLSTIITVGLYILNIVDANVDAHLMQFNVNEKLSFRPDIQQNELNNKQSLAFTLSYSFK